MAKAIFHKAQRVYVKPVGTYALVERIIPHWVKNVEAPLRVTYDVGLGREFTAGELISEETMRGRPSNDDTEFSLDTWRIQRQPNRWHGNGDTGHHPYPGTYPVIVTDEHDWGGWRVPGAEYDRDPGQIEHQARMIVNSPDLVRICKEMVQAAEQGDDQLLADIKPLAKRAERILRHVYDVAHRPAQAAE